MRLKDLSVVSAGLLGIISYVLSINRLLNSPTRPMPMKHRRTRSPQPSATTERLSTAEFLHRLRYLTSPGSFEEQDRLSTDPSSDRSGRFELRNDITGRESRAFLHAPMLTCADIIEERKLHFGAQHPPASHDEFLARRHFERAPRVISLKTKLTSSFEVWECDVHTMNDDLEPTEEERNAPSPRCSEGHGRVGPKPPIDRVGRLELLNDVTGRELRVFRKSPRPPRSSRSALPSE
jgi:hypothetical protein